MKKIFLFVSLLVSTLSLVAQDLGEIRKMILLKQYAKAKEGLDKFLGNPSNAGNPEALYYRAYVNNSYAREPNIGVEQSAQLNKEGFTAIKKYMELDPKLKYTTEEENATVFNIYYGFYDLAVKAYNAKDYAQSYSRFTDVLEVHDYIFSKNLVGGKTTKFVSLDTDVVFNMIILGNELKKPIEELMPYYKKLADAGLSEEKYLEAYEGMVMYYKKEKNTAGFNEYLAKGKATFPKDEYWEAIDIEYNTEGLEKEALFKKYDELLVKYPNSYIVAFNYGLDLNKYVFSDEPKTGDMSAMKAKIPELFKKAISIKSTVEANMLTANYYYNNSFDISEESKKIKGTKPEDAKKRAELVARSKAVMSESIPYAEEAVKLYAAMPKLKGSDKINYKQAYEILGTAYSMKGDAAKAAECDKKKKELE